MPLPHALSTGLQFHDTLHSPARRVGPSVRDMAESRSSAAQQAHKEKFGQSGNKFRPPVDRETLRDDPEAGPVGRERDTAVKNLGKVINYGFGSGNKAKGYA